MIVTFEITTRAEAHAATKMLLAIEAAFPDPAVGAQQEFMLGLPPGVASISATPERRGKVAKAKKEKEVEMAELDAANEADRGIDDDIAAAAAHAVADGPDATPAAHLNGAAPEDIDTARERLRGIAQEQGVAWLRPQLEARMSDLTDEQVRAFLRDHAA
jgi:hypothetical protein